jgi:hypothetical protein
MSARGFSRDCTARNLTHNRTVDVPLERASAKRAGPAVVRQSRPSKCTVLSKWPAGSVPMTGSFARYVGAYLPSSQPCLPQPAIPVDRGRGQPNSPSSSSATSVRALPAPFLRPDVLWPVWMAPATPA